jgi:tRNA pseudouridine38-40 synthase
VMTRLKAVLEYDGTNFCGWQVQKQQRTVQGVLEKVLSRRFEEPIKVTGAGRTDSGVHALAQVAHFDCNYKDTADTLKRNINAMLPKDLMLCSLDRAHDTFHARFDAKSRTYRYDILTTPTVFTQRYSWMILTRLNSARMKKAVQYIQGTHIFEPLAKLNLKEKHYQCTILAASVRRKKPFLEIVIQGNRFLHGMVRAIAGTLVDVGRGAKEPEIFEKILKNGDRSSVSTLAPPHGLYLENVNY